MSFYNEYDWGAWKLDLATRSEGTLPDVSLPPGTQIAYLQSVQFSDGETPAGAIDGVNKVFALANTPNPIGSLQLFCGVAPLIYIMKKGTDYTLAGVNITMTTAPLSGSELLASYRF